MLKIVSVLCVRCERAPANSRQTNRSALREDCRRTEVSDVNRDYNPFAGRRWHELRQEWQQISVLRDEDSHKVESNLGG
jgi:hypothetical protein